MTASSPVAFFLNGIGDCIINLPALRALATWADGRLRLVCSTHPATRVFEELPVQIVSIPRAQVFGGGRFEWPDAARAIGRCDLFVSLVPWWSESLASLLDRVRPDRTVGFVYRGASHFDVDLPVDYRKHAACLPFDAARAVWPEACFADFLDPPRFRERARQFVDDTKAQLPPGARLLTVHAETGESKMWSAKRFGCVISAFLERHPEYLCFLVGLHDLQIPCDGVEDRVMRTDEGALGSQRCLPLEAVQCLVSASDLFLGIDSCLLHVADFCRVPSVALFGPTRASEWGCLLTSNRTLQASGHMDDIEISDVLAAMDAMAASVSLSERRTWRGEPVTA